jgi:hypothetical protein
MPELLRTIASRLRELMGNRRRAPRHTMRLSVFVSVLDSAQGAAPAGVAGHTRDVSDGGLAVVLPAIRVGDRYLAGDSTTLRLTLKLPDASARLYGTPVRYERLEDDGQTDAGFLVGIRLNEDGDRALLAEYLKNLKK